MSHSTFHKILIVEDEPAVAARESTLLREHGYATTTVADGNTAIDVLSDDRTIDMVLVDIELGSPPDGVETARRALLVRPCPVLFVTGHDEVGTIERAGRVPHYGYLQKNTSPVVFLQAVEMAYRLFHAHREMRREKENLRATLDSVSDAVLVTDRSGRVLSCNAGVTTMFGYTVDELIGQWFVSICAVDRRRIHWEQFETALADGAAHLTDECVHKNGVSVPVQATFRVRADADGRPMGCVEVLRAQQEPSVIAEVRSEIESLESDMDRLSAQSDSTDFLSAVKTRIAQIRQLTENR